MMSSRHRYRAWTDNIIAALQQNDRICELGQWEGHKFATRKSCSGGAEPFPRVDKCGSSMAFDRRYYFVTRHRVTTSCPRFVYGWICVTATSTIPFPGLPKLLSFANGLVHLLLSDILHSGYSSPDALVACLTTAVSKISHSNFRISIASISP